MLWKHEIENYIKFKFDKYDNRLSHCYTVFHLPLNQSCPLYPCYIHYEADSKCLSDQLTLYHNAHFIHLTSSHYEGIAGTYIITRNVSEAL